MLPNSARTTKHNAWFFPTVGNIDVIADRIARMLASGRRVTLIEYVPGAPDLINPEPSLIPGPVTRGPGWLSVTLNGDARLGIHTRDDDEEAASELYHRGGPGTSIWVSGVGDRTGDRIVRMYREHHGFAQDVTILQLEDPVQGWEAWRSERGITGAPE